MMACDPQSTGEQRTACDTMNINQSTQALQDSTNLVQRARCLRSARATQARDTPNLPPSNHMEEVRPVPETATEGAQQVNTVERNLRLMGPHNPTSHNPTIGLLSSCVGGAQNTTMPLCVPNTLTSPPVSVQNGVAALPVRNVLANSQTLEARNTERTSDRDIEIADDGQARRDPTRMSKFLDMQFDIELRVFHAGDQVSCQRVRQNHLGLFYHKAKTRFFCRLCLYVPCRR